jgi:hypothetical protein
VRVACIGIGTLNTNLRWGRSRDSVVGIATSHGLDDRGTLSPSRVMNFIFPKIVQTGSEVHPTSYPMGIGGSFPGGKAAGA